MSSVIIPIIPAARYSQEKLLADGSVAGAGDLLSRIPVDEPVTRLLHPEVRYEVTDHCNATCIMCPRDKHVDGREHGIMDQALYEKSIDEVVGLGAEKVVLTGFGEPLLDKRLELKVAYRHQDNIYFDPLKFPGFGKLYGLDMSRWPTRKKRFHRDTYPGIQWNLGDFILWHGYRKGDRVFWDTRIGRGRPSWNIQDPSIVANHFQETLSIYCGGSDNLYRHHDYSLAILESLRPYPMARFWLHGHHLLVEGRKMSKSRGTVINTDDLLARGYDAAEIRFFLIYGHYRETLSYTERAMESAAERLRLLRMRAREIAKRAGRSKPKGDDRAGRIGEAFRNRMDDDLDVRGAVDGVSRGLEALKSGELQPEAAAAVTAALREIDGVLRVIF